MQASVSAPPMPGHGHVLLHDPLHVPPELRHADVKEHLENDARVPPIHHLLSRLLHVVPKNCVPGSAGGVVSQIVAVSLPDPGRRLCPWSCLLRQAEPPVSRASVILDSR